MQVSFFFFYKLVLGKQDEGKTHALLIWFLTLIRTPFLISDLWEHQKRNENPYLNVNKGNPPFATLTPLLVSRGYLFCSLNKYKSKAMKWWCWLGHWGEISDRLWIDNSCQIRKPNSSNLILSHKLFQKIQRSLYRKQELLLPRPNSPPSFKRIRDDLVKWYQIWATTSESPGMMPTPRPHHRTNRQNLPKGPTEYFLVHRNSQYRARVKGTG